jgi:hypothetical protein
MMKGEKGMMRITHIAYDEHENKYYIRFAGEPFYAMVDKMKAFGRDRAQFKPDYVWPDGREKAWYIDADALESLTDSFFNLRYQMQQAREKYEQPPLWEEDEQTRQEAIRQAQERARRLEEEARKRREEQERARRFEEEAGRRWKEQMHQSSPYAPARVQDALNMLGVPVITTKEEVKLAYRALMKLHHPDKHALASETVRYEKEQLCKKINVAYDIALQWVVVHEYSRV